MFENLGFYCSYNFGDSCLDDCENMCEHKFEVKKVNI